MKRLSILLPVCCLIRVVHSLNSAPIVKLPVGKVRGVLVGTESGDLVNLYQGIRYGKFSF
jgi:Carboxylesterase.